MPLFKLRLKKAGQGGCRPSWTQKNNRINIFNKTDSTQKLSEITNGVLMDMQKKVVTEIEIPPRSKWRGYLGEEKGTYLYNDGDAVGLRSGTIDPY